MTDYTARHIHRLDQAYPDAAATIDRLANNPTRRDHLTHVGPEMFAAELTRELAATFDSGMSLAGWAAVATTRLIDANTRLDELNAEVGTARAVRKQRDALAAELEQTRATANVRQGQLQQSRKQAAALADEVGRLTAKVAGRDKNIEQQHAENARLRRHIDALEQQLATQQPVINAANAWRWSGDTADGHRRAEAALMAAIDANEMQLEPEYDPTDDEDETDAAMLARAIDRAESALIDRDDSVWRASDGAYWTTRYLDPMTRDEIEKAFGPTRAVLLLDLDAEAVTA